ncbi:MAG TPA: acyltransferase [Negativicutes bacterium]|nr:acyltransferase [Negativicutes bacterium]
MEKKRTELQVYSGIAILFVVILHSNAYYLMNVVKLPSYIQSSLFIHIVDRIVHAAVPMFIFAAGFKYEMNNRNEAYKEFFLKKYKGIFRPFFYVSTFYLLYKWVNVYIMRMAVYNTVDMGFILNNAVKDFFRMFLGYNFAYQLWYIPMYLFIILSYPIIRRYLSKEAVRFIFFLLLAVIWEIVSNLGIPAIANNPYPLLFVYYFFIYEMGCMFYSKGYYTKTSVLVVPLYFALLAFVAFAPKVLLVRVVSDLLLYPVSTVFFYYVSVWLKACKPLITLGKYSFYIYLFHEPLILSTTSRYLLKHGLYRYGVLDPLLAFYSIGVITVLLLAYDRIRAGKGNKWPFIINKEQNKAG